MQLFQLDSQGGFTEKPNTGGKDKDSKKKSAKNSRENSTTFDYKCACLNARSIVNKRNEVNIMVEDADPHIIGTAEYCSVLPLLCVYSQCLEGKKTGFILRRLWCQERSGRQTDRQTDRQRERERDKLRNRDADRHREEMMAGGRQTDRQIANQQDREKKDGGRVTDRKA